MHIHILTTADHEQTHIEGKKKSTHNLAEIVLQIRNKQPGNMNTLRTAGRRKKRSGGTAARTRRGAAIDTLRPAEGEIAAVVAVGKMRRGLRDRVETLEASGALFILDEEVVGRPESKSRTAWGKRKVNYLSIPDGILGRLGLNSRYRRRG